MEQIIHGGGSTQLSSARSNRLCDNNDETAKKDKSDKDDKNGKIRNLKHDNSEKHD